MIQTLFNFISLSLERVKSLNSPYLILRALSALAGTFYEQPGQLVLISFPELNSLETPTAEKPDSVELAKPKCRHHHSSASCKVRCGKPNPQKKIERILANSQILTADSFSLVKDTSFSQSSWQGAPPPNIAKIQIDKMYYKKPNITALHSHLCTFYPAGYTVCEEYVFSALKLLAS